MAAAGSRRRKGRITTFFSYKGGVGRTMAVANVGFLGAMAGKRVLLMDWDLEAPGLAVYFRGITGHEAAGEIRKAPGVLDLFVNWRASLLNAATSDDVSSVFDRYAGGAPFKACAQPLVPKARLPKGAKLDIIGAGSKFIGEDGETPYAEALSEFHWPTFFSEFAGGAMLESLKAWARRSYDMILIDSRTGLADVAGICTMQLPDQVVLCFVLNRQNTEGVADIAASILATRGDDVQIRLAPMRVSKDRPTEEADARSRAQREMRKAGLSPVRVETDMVKLAIAAAPNVPFYETLAPFVATSPTADPLTFEYLRLAQEIASDAIVAPRIDAEWVEEVRRRLQPRMTTPEYLASLETADPDRAFEELDRFLDGALDADPSRELDADYVDALVSSAFQAQDWLWSDEREYPSEELGRKALLLLRQLHAMGDGDWRLKLVNAIDNFDLRYSFGGSFGKLTAEKDDILKDGPQTTDILMRRAQLRIMTARTLTLPRAADQEQELAAAEALLGDIRGPSQPEEEERFRLMHAEIAEIRANAHMAAGNRDAALDQWERLINLLRHPEDPRTRNMAARGHIGRALLIDPQSASADILTAARYSPAMVIRNTTTFERLCDIVVAAPDAETLAASFAIAVFPRTKASRLSLGVNYRGRQAVTFVRQIERLALAIGSDAPRRAEALGALTEGAESQVLRYARSGGRHDDPRQLKRVVGTYISLSETLDEAGAPEPPLAVLRQRILQLQGRPARPDE
ncbi:KGGVGR-motif variant AAA ATPase [Brevundimonas sp.]|uniref:KGGVGR-motif variant AAA ATPase n=1 Tax=Brevundimonas sp. TaxID=1871086 RepID=UPI0035B228D7